MTTKDYILNQILREKARKVKASFSSQLYLAINVANENLGWGEVLEEEIERYNHLVRQMAKLRNMSIEEFLATDLNELYKETFGEHTHMEYNRGIREAIEG